MRNDLEDNYQRALMFNDKDLLWNCIYNACRAELLSFATKKGVWLDVDVTDEIVLNSCEMVFRRMRNGVTKGSNKGKQLLPKKLGSYCYTVVSGEYIRLFRERYKEQEGIEKIKRYMNECLETSLTMY